MLGFLPRWARLPIVAVADQRVGTALLIFVVVELALGGNGYLFKAGPFRFRELLFILCMVWTVAAMLCRTEVRPPVQIWGLFGLFVATTALGIVLGFLNDNFSAGLALNVGSEIIVDPSPRAVIVAELKPLAYFPMLFFFVAAIRSRSEVTIVVTTLVLAGAFLATAYLLTIASAHVGLVSYATIHDHLKISDEFIFRLQYADAPFVGFLYKGMYYVCVSALLLMFDPFKPTKAFAVVTVLAVALTMTRSLTVALGACIAIGLAWGPWSLRQKLASQLLLLIVVAFVAFQAESRIAQMPSTASASKLSRETDRMRQSDVAFVWAHTNIPTLAIGQGLGAKIGKRTKIELTYVEVVYKQGILGLMVWFLLFAYSCWLYSRVPAIQKNLGRALLLCSIFFFISTTTNTVLTGSIGMGAVFIVLACLSVLARESVRVEWYSDLMNGLPHKLLAG
jgi:hypothetical protein